MTRTPAHIAEHPRCARALSCAECVAKFPECYPGCNNVLIACEHELVELDPSELKERDRAWSWTRCTKCGVRFGKPAPLSQ